MMRLTILLSLRVLLSSKWKHVFNSNWIAIERSMSVLFVRFRVCPIPRKSLPPSNYGLKRRFRIRSINR